MSFDKTLIYLTSDPRDLSPNSSNPLKICIRSQLSNSDIFFEDKRRFNKEILKVSLQISGIKDYDAYLISDQIFQMLVYEAEKSFRDISNQFPLSSSNSQNKLLVLKKYFESLLKIELNKRSYCELNLEKLELAFLVTESKINMVILLGGTSGTGKSSVASLLATKIGVPTVLSTDSIRHIMRNFFERESYPILFASTYEAGKKLPAENDSLTEKQKVIKGYQMQSALIQEKIESLIEQFNEKKESIVIEGVHLTPDFLKKISKKYENCVPFLIYISNESKHKERFAVRSKYMTLDERFNKYIENFQNIRIIQKFLIKKSNENLISKMDNTNIDKSMGLILKTIMSYFRKLYIRKETIPDNNNLLYIYEQFNKLNKNVWSSQAVKDYVTSKVNKADLLNMKMENLIENLTLTIERSPPSESNIAETKTNDIKSEHQSVLESNNKSEGNKNENFKIEKHDLNFNATIYETIRKKSEYLDAELKELETSGDRLENVVYIEKKRPKIQIKDIRELLEKKNKISLDKNISLLNLKKIKRVLNDLNKRHKKEEKYYRLHIMRANERFIIFKRTNSLKEMGINNKEIAKSPHSNLTEHTNKNQKFMFKHLSKDDTSGKNDDFYGITSGTDDDEISSTSELKSNDMKSSLNAESMEVNFQGTFKDHNSVEEMLHLSEPEDDSFKIEEEMEDKLDDTYEEEQNSVENSDNKSFSSGISEEEKKNL